MANNEPAKDAPIFIVGSPRSGTTLLRLMLNQHPRIAIPPESLFLPQLYKPTMANPDTNSVLAELEEHPWVQA